MKPTVYIETTIISCLTARPSRDPLRAAHEILTRKWWNERRNRFMVYTSEFVVDEASMGDPEAAAKRINELKAITLLEGTSPVKVLAASLSEALQLPSRAIADAAHVAVAAVYGLEYLLTWNCTHLANPALTGKIVKVCGEGGYVAPQIVTPEMLMEAS